MSYRYHRLKLPGGSTRDEHRLVVEAAMGRPLGRYEIVHHINGDGKDNRLDNLEVTNLRDHARHHLAGKAASKRGEQVGTARLTEAKVRAILALLRHDWSNRRLSRYFGVGGTTISHVRLGHTWRHVERPPCYDG